MRKNHESKYYGKKLVYKKPLKRSILKLSKGLQEVTEQSQDFHIGIFDGIHSAER